MKNYFWTADTHFDHKNILKYCKRPFECTQEMNETIIENWNKKVGRQDIVYHLGDFALRNSLKYLKRLNGNIRIILGNHDHDIIRIDRSFIKQGIQNIYFQIFPPQHEVKIKDKTIIMNHYSMRVWNKSCYGSWHVYGHSHGVLKPYGKSWDVGVDNNNFEPLALEDLFIILEKLPYNGNGGRP